MSALLSCLAQGKIFAYAYGIMPAGASRADAGLDAKYADFKTRYYVDCDATKIRVARDQGNAGTVSEGQGYGFILTAYLEPDATGPAIITKLWNFVQSKVNGNGLMNWEVTCTTVTGAGPAPDGDEDIVIGLMQAENRWPGNNFGTWAQGYAQKMLQYEVDACGLRPGEWAGCGDITNPSYEGTGYFRCWANWGQTYAGRDWFFVINKAYNPHNKYWYDNYALTPDWVFSDTGIITDTAWNTRRQYYYDAARTPWRLAPDYLWYGNTTAQAMCNKITNFFKASDPNPATIVDGYMAVTGQRMGTFHSGVFVGPVACGAMVDPAHQAYLNLAYADVKALPQRSYYEDSWRLLSLLMLSGVFTNPCAYSAGTPTNTPTNTPYLGTPTFTRTRTPYISPTVTPTSTAGPASLLIYDGDTAGANLASGVVTNMAPGSIAEAAGGNPGNMMHASFVTIAGWWQAHRWNKTANINTAGYNYLVFNVRQAPASANPVNQFWMRVHTTAGGNMDVVDYLDEGGVINTAWKTARIPLSAMLDAGQTVIDWIDFIASWNLDYAVDIDNMRLEGAAPPPATATPTFTRTNLPAATATNTAMAGKAYKAAEIRTNVSYLYGRFEVKMRASYAPGVLSTFFTFNDDNFTVPQWNELDVEVIGQYNDRVQFNTITYNHTMHEHMQMLSQDPTQCFIDYAIEWAPTYVAWFVDGAEVYRDSGAHVAELTFTQKFMINHWATNLAAWAGTFNPASLPLYCYYDYAAYYSYTPGTGNYGTGNNFTQQWRDDFNTFDAARWSKATHTFAENVCDFLPANAVVKDGHLVLAITDAYNQGFNGAIPPDCGSTPTFTRTATRTRTATATHTRTLTPSFTSTRTNTAAITPTFTATGTGTQTFTLTRTSTWTRTLTATRTQSPDYSPTETSTGTPPTETVSPTVTETETEIPADTEIPTGTLTPTCTVTRTTSPAMTITLTNSPVLTFTRTNSPTMTITSNPSPSFTATRTRTQSVTPTASLTMTITSNISPSFTATRTRTNGITMTITITLTRIVSPTPTHTSSVPAQGEIGIKDIAVFPFPLKAGSGPLTLRLNFSGRPEKVFMDIYTMGFRRVRMVSWKSGITYPVCSLAVPADKLAGLSGGTYYYIMRAEDAAGKKSNSVTKVLLILK